VTRHFLQFLAGVWLSALAVLGEESGAVELVPVATVHRQGVLLSDLIRSTDSLPFVVLAPAPSVGRPVYMNRFQVKDLVERKAPELKITNWFGADRIKIVRATRMVDETVVKELLTAVLQMEQVKERGALELRLARPWTSVPVADEPLSIKVTELPSAGVSPHFICRFELLAGGESAGSFQQPLQAKIWRDIYVARSSLTRGQSLRDADIGLESRDILGLKDYRVELPIDNPYVEFRENIMASTPISERALRLRAILKRGRMVDAVVQDPTLSISVRAEVLEDGVPGQMVRLRNVRSKREFKGKVQDEQTVLVTF
jgi:flagella basal body P-ring formation protein FlgA